MMYDREFRAMVLNQFITNKNFYNRFNPYFKLKYFKEISFQLIKSAIDTYRFKYEEETIQKSALKIELIDLLENRGIDITELEEDINYVYSFSNINIDLLEEKLKKWLQKERVVEALQVSIEKIKSGDLSGIKTEIENAFNVNFDTDYGIVFFDEIENMYEIIEEKYSSKNLVRTGFRKIDNLLMGGFGKGEVYSIMGKPKSGKSTFAVNLGYNVLLQGYAVVHITLELQQPDIAFKYSLLMTDMTYKEVLENKEIFTQKLKLFKQKHKEELFIKWYPNKSITYENIISYITSLKLSGLLTKPIGLIIIDYDDLILPVYKEGNMYDDSGNVYFDLVKLAERYKCPVLTLSQPNRKGWYKIIEGDLLTEAEVSHSAKKIMNCTAFFTLNNLRNDKYVLNVPIVRRGKSGDKINLKANLEKAKFYEEE